MNPNTALFGLVYLLTLFVAPLIALWIQGMLNDRKDEHQRKVWIFRTLMATRASPLDPRRVEALNAIQVEFQGGGAGAKVHQRWKEYLEHLATPTDRPSPEAWNEKSVDCFIQLLYEMSRYLSYNFDPIDLKRQFYFPTGHGDIETDTLAIRKGLVQLLTGNLTLRMNVVGFPVDDDLLQAQRRLTELSTEWLDGKRSVVVLIPKEKSEPI